MAIENIKSQQEVYKQNYDRTARYPQFDVGDQVLLYTPSIKPGTSPKLTQKYHGPYYITDANDQNFTYSITDSSTHKVHPSRVHANRLKLFHSPANRLYNAYDPVATTRPPVDRQTDNDITTPPQSTADSTDPPAAPSNNSSSVPSHAQTTNYADATDNDGANPTSADTADDDAQATDNSAEDTQTSRNNDEPAPDPTNDSREWFAAERILSSRLRKNKREFRVSWLNSSESPSWCPAVDVSPAQIREFNIRWTAQRRKRKRRN